MIFVTVGTHEQPFDRLVKYVDELKGSGAIREDVVIQTGFSTYEPKHCIWGRLFPFPEMEEYVSAARIVITHGGPSSFMMALRREKTPIVVPRRKRFDEHINDHQVAFSKAIAERTGTILVAETMQDLKKMIANYEELARSRTVGFPSNNERFNAEFGLLAGGLIRAGRRQRTR